MTGYFAFPPTPKSASARVPFASTQNTPTTPADDAQTATNLHDHNDNISKLKDHAWEERRRRDAETHETRLQREKEEAWQGELAWVRSGGIVRDARGRRDKARTELLKAEIRLQDEERRIMDRWNAYETRWRVLSMSSADSITWSDIPWPVHAIVEPSYVDDLTPDAISEFVFAPLKVRANTSSRKERIRSSILRWHPDKVAAILGRVVEDQQDFVRDGVNTVFRILRDLQDADKNI